MDPMDRLADQLWEGGLRTLEGDVVGDDTAFPGPPFGSGWEAGDLAFRFAALPSALDWRGNVAELTLWPSIRGIPCFVTLDPDTEVLDVTSRVMTGPAAPLRMARDLGSGRILLAGALAPDAPPVRLQLPVPDPALWCAERLAQALRQRGIVLEGACRARHQPLPGGPGEPAGPPLQERAAVESAPLEAAVRKTLKDSDNLHAQLLLLQAGMATAAPGPLAGPRGARTPMADMAATADPAAPPPLTAEQRGVQALQAFLGRAGIGPDDVVMEEGAGLSRKDAVKPSALVRLLVFMDRHPAGEVFRSALPLAGRDGTLARRLAGARGRVAAKTGTLRGVHALSGYALTAGGERLAFAFLLEDPGGDGRIPAPEEDLDALVLELVRTP
jgi:D-alanyl-D-alanine carboxypeptidase/D-alanyl-D-alanine-endopeptidase (penicillin-binding protein 4)